MGFVSASGCAYIVGSNNVAEARARLYTQVAMTIIYMVLSNAQEKLKSMLSACYILFVIHKTLKSEICSGDRSSKTAISPETSGHPDFIGMWAD